MSVVSTVETETTKWKSYTRCSNKEITASLSIPIFIPP